MEQNKEPAAWLWPDRVIGKREARRLREEYNRVYNDRAALIEQRNALLAALEGVSSPLSVILDILGADEDIRAKGRRGACCYSGAIARDRLRYARAVLALARGDA